MPVSAGRWSSSSVNASSPPAEAPTPTTKGSVPGASRSPAAGRTTVPGRLPVFFANRHHYLSRRKKQSTCRATLMFPTRRRADRPHKAMVCPTSACPTEQILDGLADLHELIQAGRFGDELGNSQVPEQRLVSPGLGRTPHANPDAGEVFRRPNLAQDVFAGVLGEVQVHQDQVWNGRVGISPLPADEGEGFAAVQQVNQFKWKILFFQGPIEEEDIRGVVFNHQYPGRGNNRSVHQAHV